MLNLLYLSWVDTLEAHMKATIHLADQAHGQGLQMGLATNDALMRIWFPWL